MTTPRERVWQSIRHSAPDRVPYHFSYTVGAKAKLQSYYGTDDLDGVLDNHIVKFKPRPAFEPLGGPFWRDAFGVVWDRSIDRDIGVVRDFQLKTRSLSGYTFPDPDDPQRYAALPAFVEANPDRFRVINLGFSLFERAWTLRGMTDLLVDLLQAPAFVDELFDAITRFNLGIIAQVVRHDIDAVMFGDDWGQQTGLLFSPRLWRRFVKPRLAVMYGAVKRAGKAVFIHSCGKVQELFPELIELGLDVFNPFQPEVMNPYEIKKQFGRDLSFYGGMSIQRLLPYGTPSEIREQARRLMDEVGRDGGFIIAPSHDMPGDIPIQNMVAFINAVREV